MSSGEREDTDSGILKVHPLDPNDKAGHLFGPDGASREKSVIIRNDQNPGAVFLLNYSGDAAEAEARIRKFLHDIGDQFLDIMEELKR
jgi:hypothetical protein